MERGLQQMAVVEGGIRGGLGGGEQQGRQVECLPCANPITGLLGGEGRRRNKQTGLDNAEEGDANGESGETETG